MKVTIKYDGGLNEELEDEIGGALKKHGLEKGDSGYNFISGERDVEYTKKG